MSEYADEARTALLAEAAEPARWPAGLVITGPAGQRAGAGTGVPGDVPGYLRAYFRHFPTEDLAAARAERIAGVASAHAVLAARRPQGRALVQVMDLSSASSATPATPVAVGPAALGAARVVVDIVTDDMPYLVDSVTMELNRHQADIQLIVHPLLRVRRNVAGALLDIEGHSGDLDAGVSGASVSGASVTEVTESWIHVEIGRFGHKATLGQLESDLRRVLDDVRVACEDQQRMRSAASVLANVLTGGLTSEPQVSQSRAGNSQAVQAAEAGELLRWLADGHFTFLGFREYGLAPDGAGMAAGEVPGTGLGVLRHDRQGSEAFVAHSLHAPAPPGTDEPDLLVLAKANSRSTVGRPNYLDYISVKKLDFYGRVAGEFRFLGLYTHAAYAESIGRIPVLRHKISGVLAAAGIPADSHDGNDLIEILESYPREELFQISVDQLTPIALGVLRLRERKQTRLFLRPDTWGRYMSCLVYLPRDRYTTEIRLRAQEILRQALHGVSVDYSAMVGESALARLHVVVHGEPGRPIPDVDAAALERKLAAAVRSWDEDLAAEAARGLGDERARQLIETCGLNIPETYKADVPAAEAVGDLDQILRMRESGSAFSVRLEEGDGSASGLRRLRVYRSGSPITLSDVLPQLQHMGVEVVDEHPYEFADTATDNSFWIYDFGLRSRLSSTRGRGDLARQLFEDAITALWHGLIEDDGFNALVLDGGLTWRDVIVLRAYAKYLRQAGTRFSQDYIQRVLRSNVTVTRLLVRLFESMFDPARRIGEYERSEAIAEEIRGELDDVVSLDHDRILRSYLALIDATLRTNHYQPAQRGLSKLGGLAGGPAAAEARLVIKLDPGKVPGLPTPRPQFEIFVYSPRLEAVHLRFGRVARGGLRWSDRLEDFRTEVLGLVKAQEVKNAVIVPSGAKGGFVCKQLPDSADREAYQGEVLACYRIFISAMLDITDNIVSERVAPPPDVVRRDGDDPYLVVAADKGTATFSDVANEIAAGYGFWLGDAFASGGSEGYDHKKMGITARGAWESVRAHFAALGMNPGTDDFTVAGIGDMSGDVFGNGMLLSRHIKLVAAFDHRHVFVDPDPDPAVSFAERERMFALPRSSWADYDVSLISAGGGVWPRSAKSVPVSPQARAALGIDAGVAALPVDELISAMLAAPVDLLWNGGIGTYVKADSESHADVGDRSSEAVRINASRLRAKVVAEGGNLGLTPAARVEFALAGGLVNTDFIDNSAGVDTSDHEVNIKVLLDDVIRNGRLAGGDRKELLQEMTDEVASLVLRHNYHQNMALATARAQAPQLLHVHARYLRRLEREKRISRERDGMPDEKEIAERRSSGRGLTSPELALLLAHTKISAGQDVLASGLSDDPYLQRVLAEYFPAPLRTRYADAAAAHPLRREIITTSVVNEMVDSSGTTFAFRLTEETGASLPDITQAWLVARDVFGMQGFWARVEALDGQVDIATQIRLLFEGRKLVERACRWLLHNRRPPFDIAETIGFFADGVATVRSGLPKTLGGRDLAGFEERSDSFAARGVPADLADQVAAMVPTYSAFDIVQSAAATRRGIEETAEVYFDLADRLQITRLRDRITALAREDRWSTMARSALRDDLYAAHAALACDVLGVSGPGTPEERLAVWARHNEAAVTRASQTLTEIWESDRFTFTTLSVALRTIRTLVAASSLPPA